MYRLRGRFRLTAALTVAALGVTTAGTLVATGAGAASAPALPQVKVTMDKQHLAVSGALVSGAVSVTATVSGENQGDFAFVHLNPGVSYARFQHFAKHNFNDPNAVSEVGSIVLDYGAPRGTSTVQTVLPAGKYAAVDVSSDQTLEQGARAEFEVARAEHPAPLPAASETVRAIEFGFRGADTLHRGDLVRFENTGYLVHMIVAVHARNDADAQKLAEALRKGDDGAAQKLATGFTSFLEPSSRGAVVQHPLTAAKGAWVIACFIDTQDGREHTQLGMVKLIHVQ